LAKIKIFKFRFFYTEILKIENNFITKNGIEILEKKLKYQKSLENLNLSIFQIIRDI